VSVARSRVGSKVRFSIIQFVFIDMIDDVSLGNRSVKILMHANRLAIQFSMGISNMASCSCQSLLSRVQALTSGVNGTHVARLTRMQGSTLLAQVGQ